MMDYTWLWVAVLVLGYIGILISLIYVQELQCEKDTWKRAAEAISIAEAAKQDIKQLRERYDELNTTLKPIIDAVDNKELKAAVREFGNNSEWLIKLIDAKKKAEELKEDIRQLRW